MLLEKKQGDEGYWQLQDQWEEDRMFVYDKELGKGEWVERPHITAWRAETKKADMEITKEMLENKKNAVLFRDKIEELDDKIRDSRLYLSILAKKYLEAEGENKDWAGWAMERERERMAEYKKELKRFEMYHQQCLGRVNVEKRMLDVTTAKETPISAFMPEPPSYKTQDNWKFKCPLHNEKTASFVWYKRNNTWYCFGCGKGGDNIDLYKQLFKTDFVTAVSELLRLA